MGKHPQEQVYKYYGSKVGLDIGWFLSGECYMPSKEFVPGLSKDKSSVRIPLKVATDGRGYIEDRRPMSNADPYEVCMAMTKSALF